MKNKILREYIKETIREVLEGPHISNVLSQDLTSREQLGSIADPEDEKIISHLSEPEVDLEDCYGPVPPISDDVGVFPDMYTKDYHVIPHSPIYRS
jgi:hypothetical protein